VEKIFIQKQGKITHYSACLIILSHLLQPD